MQCSNCAREISEKNKFCPFCGSPQNRVEARGKTPAGKAKCSGCGTDIKAGHTFCLNCGTPLRSGSGSAGAAIGPTSGASQDTLCPGCGREVKTSQTFCMNCGARLPVVQNVEGPAVSGPGKTYAQDHVPLEQDLPAAYSSRYEPAAGGNLSSEPLLKGSGVGIRFAATLLDGVIISTLIKLMGFTMGGMISSQADGMAYPGTLDYSIYYVPAVIGMAYFILMEGLAGGTLGKLICGLRVVTKNGEKCGVGKSIIRNLMRIVDGLFVYLVGALCIWLSRDNQRLGDMAASTLVVKKRDLKR